jgi:hypothetical protein
MEFFDRPWRGTRTIGLFPTTDMVGYYHCVPPGRPSRRFHHSRDNLRGSFGYGWSLCNA